MTFNKGDRDACTVLSETNPFILNEIPAVLDQFYDHVGEINRCLTYCRFQDQHSDALI